MRSLLKSLYASQSALYFETCPSGHVIVTSIAEFSTLTGAKSFSNLPNGISLAVRADDTVIVLSSGEKSLNHRYAYLDTAPSDH